jgi:Na+-transporting methylmalonyl-CoA/oxaloacetate decarboxylase gamma subunit
MCRQVAQTSRHSLIDLVVALVSVPLLVVFGLMLESNMRGDWTGDPEKRWRVLGLGLVLLFVSILVCGHVTHRLGICIWAASQEPTRPSHVSNVSRRSLKEHRVKVKLPLCLTKHHAMKMYLLPK